VFYFFSSFVALTEDCSHKTKHTKPKRQETMIIEPFIPSNRVAVFSCDFLLIKNICFDNKEYDKKSKIVFILRISTLVQA
jgi:hypothetical protein